MYLLRGEKMKKKEGGDMWLVGGGGVGTATTNQK